MFHCVHMLRHFVSIRSTHSKTNTKFYIDSLLYNRHFFLLPVTKRTCLQNTLLSGDFDHVMWDKSLLEKRKNLGTQKCSCSLNTAKNVQVVGSVRELLYSTLYNINIILLNKEINDLNSKENLIIVYFF